MDVEEAVAVRVLPWCGIAFLGFAFFSPLLAVFPEMF